MDTRIHRSIGAIVALAALMLAVSCSVQVIQPLPDPNTEPAAYTQHLVNRAIDYYKANGRDAAIEFYNSAESVDGQWYVFIIDENDNFIAHATIPGIRGTSVHERVDIVGFNYGAALAAATEAGIWVDYLHRNPDSGEFQSKHTWVVNHDGWIFGAGWYEVIAEGDPRLPDKSDPAAYTLLFVEQALEYYRAEGLEATVAYYNTPESMDGPWYVFIGDENDVMLAHASVPENVGMRFADILGPGGYPAGAQVAAAATEEGAWTSYTYYNSAADAFQSKHTWVLRYEGRLFGSGWYEEGPSKSDPAAYTQEFVQQAIRLYDAVGRDAAFAYYNTPESVDDDWYIFIIDENENTIIHPTRPEIRGTSSKTRLDITGYAYGYDLVTADEEGKWVSYFFTNPQTGYEDQKHTWAIKHDGYIFASGWYERDVDVDDATYTQFVVHRAIQRYDAQGLEATIEYFNSPESVEGQWYVFVLDENQVTIGHYNPEHIGRTREMRIDARGYDYGADFLKATAEGTWIDYVFLNPETEKEMLKHTWLRKHNGLYFGSGWYEEVKEE